MPETCDIQEGGLKQHKQTAGKYFLHKISLYGYKFFLYSATLIFSYLITGYVFSTCIIPNNLSDKAVISLSDCISLGSIFATFGSAVIAVFSLVSSSQISSFEQKLVALRGQFSTYEATKWIRWEFLSRQSRERCQKGHYVYYKLDNAALCVKMNSEKLSLPIPTVHKDFWDLPILSSWWKMYRRKSSYRAYLQKENCIADFLIWDCLFSMYKNIILYRMSEFLIWTGAVFVINSIIYAFTYG